MSETEQCYKGLSELLLVDQLMEGASEGLKIFLKERKSTYWAQTLDLAENYRVAHFNRGMEQPKFKPKLEGP